MLVVSHEAKRSGVARSEPRSGVASMLVVSHEAKRSGVHKARNGTPLALRA